MGLEKVKDEILNNANREASRIKEEANNEVKKAMDDSEQRVNSYRNKANEDAKSIIESMKTKEKASAELELKKLNLDAKKALIEKVFVNAKNKICKLDENKRKEMIKKLLEKSIKELEIKSVYCNKIDAKFIQGFDVKVENILGGIIAENDDGSVRVNYSYDSLLQSVRENSLKDVAKILFGQNVN